MDLHLPALYLKQVGELEELIGFEARNKYRITGEGDIPVGFAAEQQSGIFGFLLRQVFGHWREFEIHFFDASRQVVMVARHPFRFFFQRLEVQGAGGEPVGAIQQRFSFFTKRFDVEDAQGQVVLEVASPLLSFWTFPFTRGGQEVARVEKQWSGLLKEAFTDKDNFRVVFEGDLATETERALVLAAAVFIDLQYFESRPRRPVELSDLLP